MAPVPREEPATARVFAGVGRNTNLVERQSHAAEEKKRNNDHAAELARFDANSAHRTEQRRA